jgi:hypothetical protein
MLESEGPLTSSKLQRASFDPDSLGASSRDRPAQSAPSRCREKGCIFPATPLSPGKCLLHYLEECEPALFLSCQPTTLLLDRAKFGLPDIEGDDWRARDRRRLAALREKFLEEVA